MSAYGLLGVRDLVILKSGVASPFYDFHVYTRAFQNAITATDPYAIRTIGPAYIYPPQALFVLAPIAALPSGVVQTILWLAFNVALLSLLLVLIMRRYGYGLPQTSWWFFLALAFGPTLETLYTGQVNLVVASASYLTFALEEAAPLAGGLALAVAISMKVSPATLGLYLLSGRRWRAIGATALGVAALAFAAGLAFGWTPLLTYAGVFRHLMAERLTPDGNVESLATTLVFNGLLAPSQMGAAQAALTAYSCLVALAGVALAGRSGDRAALFVVLSLATMSAPAVVWYHHFVFIVPALFLWMASRRLNRAVVTWCVFGMVLIECDRFALTYGLLSQLFVQASILALVAGQARQVLASAKPSLPALPALNAPTPIPQYQLVGTRREIGSK